MFFSHMKHTVRRYVQLDQPRKVRFGINAVEVYGLL